jgi:hypothetical protein
MIRFVVIRPHAYTVSSLVMGRFGAETPPCEAFPYDELFASRRVPSGTYVFCDIERLSDHDLLLAAETYRVLSAAPRCLVLNNPAHVKVRYALLRSLKEAGLNTFDAYRADGHPRPERFPVFIRAEAAHDPALSDLLPDQEALDKTLHNLRMQGRPLRGLIVIEFCAEPVMPDVFRRYGTFRIGNEIHLDHVVTEDSWNVKWGKLGFATEEMYQEDDRAIRENRYSGELREAFRIAEIEYGRADFGIVNGRPQIYEINTNPHLGGLDEAHPSATRRASIEFAHKRFAEFLGAIYVPDAGEVVTLDAPLLSAFRNAGSLKEQIRSILTSRSWWYTSPLRKALYALAQQRRGLIQAFKAMASGRPLSD